MSSEKSAIDACNETRAALIAAYRALPYKDYLRTDHWLSVRASAIDRNNNRCQLCGEREKLHVHHITYKNLGEERPEDLTVVCQKCHAKFHAEIAPVETTGTVKGAELKRREANPREIIRIDIYDPYRLQIRFRDNTERSVDFAKLLSLEEFVGIGDKEMFGQITVDGNGDLKWPNGAQMKRDVLYEWHRHKAEWEMRARGDDLAKRMKQNLAQQSAGIIEVKDGDVILQYRQRRLHPHVIEVRVKAFGATWESFKRYGTPDAASTALLALTKQEPTQ